MMCIEVQYEDEYKDVVVYGDQGLTQKSMKKLHMGN